MMGKRFENLMIWKKSYDLVLQFYKSKINFPSDEKYGIENQLKRALVSVPANIAEGCKRQYVKEFIQFLYIAKGSLSEARFYFMLCRDLDIIEIEMWRDFNNQCNEIERMLEGYIKKLNKSCAK
jgi:four helix bundle protein